MMQLSELCLFLTDDIYLIKNDIVSPILDKNAEKISHSIGLEIAIQELEDEDEIEAKVQEVIAPVIPRLPEFKPTLFVFDVELSDLAAETFNNLVSKGLALTENDFSVITQEQVSFKNPEEINSSKVVLFDVPFSGHTTKYKLTHSSGQLVLLADSMEKIAQNVDMKRSLWAQLQLMYPKKS